MVPRRSRSPHRRGTLASRWPAMDAVIAPRRPGDLPVQGPARPPRHPGLSRQHEEHPRGCGTSPTRLRDTYKTIVLVSPVMKIPSSCPRTSRSSSSALPRSDDFNGLLDRIIEDVKDKPQDHDQPRRRGARAAGPRRARADAQGGGERLRQDAGARRQARRRRHQRRLQREAADHPQERDAGVLRQPGAIRPRRRAGEPQGLAAASGARPSANAPRSSACPLPRGSCCWASRGAARASAPRRRPASGSCRCSGSTSAGCSAAWSARARRACGGRSRRPRASRRRSSGSTRSTRRSPARQGSAGSDGGTASRVFGTFLTWLSEKTAPVFVIATANDISQPPPETAAQGAASTRSSSSTCRASASGARSSASTSRSGSATRRGSTSIALARQCDGFSGAEIEEAIISGLFDAFSKGADLDTEILRAGLAETVPLSRTMSEELNRLRTWAQGRARTVHRDPVATGRRRGRSETASQARDLRSDVDLDLDRPPQEIRPMSTVLVVTPLIIAGWPVLTAAITAAVGTMGFAAAQNTGPRVRQRRRRPRAGPRSRSRTARSSPAPAGPARRWSSSATASAPSSAATPGGP